MAHELDANGLCDREHRRAKLSVDGDIRGVATIADCDVATS
jgi:hypothetical protein